jgi:hypothetical protein
MAARLQRNRAAHLSFGAGMIEFRNKPAGGNLIAAAETGGEVLAGVRTIRKGDLGYR